jgi:hypothetical protein
VEYVELMHTDVGNTTDDIGADIMSMHRTGFDWIGFQWVKVKGHIETAQAALDKEPPSKFWTDRLPFDRYRKVVLDGGDGRRREMTELLDRLRELS